MLSIEITRSSAAIAEAVAATVDVSRAKRER